MEEGKTELKKLLHVRGGHRGFVTKTINRYKADNATAKVARAVLEARRVTLANLTNDIIARLEKEEDILKEIDEHSEFETTILDCLQTIEEAEIGLRGTLQQPHPPPQAPPRAPTATVRLPKLHIPKFSGALCDWTAFWEVFYTSVHNSTALSSVEKFSYLVSLLEGSALQTIKGMPITDANYEAAIVAMQSRYGNKQALVNAHMEKLFNVRPVNSGDVRALRSFYDYVMVQIRSLEGAGVGRESFNSLLLPLLLNKLPSFLKLKLANVCKDQEWQLTDLLDLLEAEVKAREKCGLAHNSSPGSAYQPHSRENYHKLRTAEKPQFNSTMLSSTSGRNRTFPATNTFVNANVGKQSCQFCFADHLAKNCTRYKTKEERVKAIQEKALCYSCLLNGHRSKECKNNCAYCRKQHHISICPTSKFNAPGPRGNSQLPRAERAARGPDIPNDMVASALATSDMVLLQTAKTTCCSPSGTETEITILFDKGSQRTYITQSLYEKLNLCKLGTEICRINTFAQHETSTKKCTLVEVPLKTTRGIVHICALTVPVICSNFTQRCEGNEPNLWGLDMGNANVSGTIDMLIGCDHYWTLVNGELRNQHSGPVAMNSALGWLASGVQSSSPGTKLIRRIDTTQTTMSVLGSESPTTIGSPIPEFDDEFEETDLTMEQFRANISFDGTRYCVRFPWRTGFSLQTNYLSMAYSRLQHLLRRLEAHGSFQEYNHIIQNYLQQGYIEPARDWPARCCYLAHHGVHKKRATTTKLRIVFDGSVKAINSLSLNECLYKGPTLTADVTTLLMRFRFEAVAIIADLQEAFLQIGIADEERDMVRFLWTNQNQLKAYRFCRVPFGLSCSPFLLNATLQYHLQQLPELDQICFYVDDLILQAPDAGAGIAKAEKTKAHLESAGFRLHKWSSNNAEVAAHFGVEAPTTQKVLGLHWDTQGDTMWSDTEHLRSFKEDQKLTKRLVLSAVASTFDPLGLISCVVIRLRIFFQKLCTKEYDWNDEVGPELRAEFFALIKDVASIDAVRIPRWARFDNRRETEVHVFADASNTAYGACMYLRVKVDDGYHCTLVRSKARVKPKREVTMPKLELAAAVVGTKLYRDLIVEFPAMKEHAVTLWSDSMAVLGWITGTKQWPAYVENRVALVRQLALTQRWRYVPTDKNPADLLSRGVKAKTLQTCGFWFQGPRFLRDVDANENVPMTQVNMQVHSDLSEPPTEPTANTYIFNVCDVFNVERFSTMLRVLRSTAFVYRFIHNARRRHQRQSGPLTTDEIVHARTVLLKISQQQWYPEERRLLEKGADNPLIRSLDLELHDDGLIHVSTRLKHAEIPLSTRCPVLISGSSWLTTLIVRQIHILGLHCGVSQTLASVRAEFWIPKGRQCVKKVVHRCVTCRKFAGRPYRDASLPALPQFRVDQKLPFVNIGIDFAGPLQVKANLTVRSRTMIKAYICLITCAVTRAVHLEMTLDLTTQSFLQAFRRFVARRGTPSVIYTDNGTTFTSASKLIASRISGLENADALDEFCQGRQIRWDFIVPRASWWGGFYERMVGLVKCSLKRVLGNAALTYLEFETLLIEVESTVNNRPLTYVAEDSDPITPSLLLTGRNEFAPRIQDDTTSDHNSMFNRRKYQRVLLSQFWNAFMKEYLLSLRERSTARKKGENIQIAVGDIVHVYNSGPRSQWRVAAVEELLPGADQVARAAVVRLPAKGKHHQRLTRAIKHLYPLEAREEVQQDATMFTVADNTHNVPSGRSKRPTSSSLPNGVWFTLALLLLTVILGYAHCDTVASCQQLACMREEAGEVAHFDIYAREEWISHEYYVCSRRRTTCSYFSNFVATHSQVCSTSSLPVTREACLVQARTKMSVDGPLRKQTAHVFHTTNVVKEQYAWMRTMVDTRVNSYLEVHSMRTNGSIVESAQETMTDACYFETGQCGVLNKTMAWFVKSLCPLRYTATEICHIHKAGIFCAETDFDAVGYTKLCGQRYVNTTQGLLLWRNDSQSVQRRHHWLNAAVIQHLLDKIERLERLVKCLAQNQRCEAINTTVGVPHERLGRFEGQHVARAVEEGTIEDIIKDDDRQAENRGGYIEPILGSRWWFRIPVWLRWVGSVMSTLITMAGIAGLAKWVVWPILTTWGFPLLQRCCRRRHQAVPEEREMATREGSRHRQEFNYQAIRQVPPRRHSFDPNDIGARSSPLERPPLRRQNTTRYVS